MQCPVIVIVYDVSIVIVYDVSIFQATKKTDCKDLYLWYITDNPSIAI